MTSTYRHYWKCKSCGKQTRKDCNPEHLKHDRRFQAGLCWTCYYVDENERVEMRREQDTQAWQNRINEVAAKLRRG